MVALEDGPKTNIGLSLKFESKGLKVLGYSRRNDRGWEFSETTARALENYKVRSGSSSEIIWLTQVAGGVPGGIPQLRFTQQR